MFFSACVRMRVCAYIPTLYKKCGYNHDFGYPVTERSSKMLEKDLIAKIPAEQMLANAIIIQAADDYRASLRSLKHMPDSSAAAVLLENCESFFLSDLKSRSGCTRRRSEHLPHVPDPAVSLEKV